MGATDRELTQVLRDLRDNVLQAIRDLPGDDDLRELASVLHTWGDLVRDMADGRSTLGVAPPDQAQEGGERTEAPAWLVKWEKKLGGGDATPHDQGEDGGEVEDD